MRTLTLYRLPATGDIFRVETGGEHNGDYRCSIGRPDAPHSFIVEAERAGEVVSFCRQLEVEGWQKE